MFSKFECAACQHSLDENPRCLGQWALTFDVTFQYPLGPVCDWPDIIDCTLTCPEDAECQGNDDCGQCSGGYCNVDCTCTYSPPCGCTEDSECQNSDGICNLPPPHTPDFCAYCEAGQCEGGCVDNENCPDGYQCTDHLCQSAVCLEDTECVGFDQICNENYDNCFYCGAGDCNASDGCCPGITFLL